MNTHDYVKAVDQVTDAVVAAVNSLSDEHLLALARAIPSDTETAYRALGSAFTIYILLTRWRRANPAAWGSVEEVSEQ